MKAKTEFNSDILEKNNTDIQFVQLSFKRSFWLIFIAIAAIQIFDFSLAVYYGMDLTSFPPRFYLFFELGSIIWFLFLLFIVIYDLYLQNTSPMEVFNFNLTIAKDRISQTLKYFSGCAVFILLLSFLRAGTELKLEYLHYRIFRYQDFQAVHSQV